MALWSKILHFSKNTDITVHITFLTISRTLNIHLFRSVPVTNITATSFTVSWNSSSTCCPDHASCSYSVRFRMDGNEICPMERIKGIFSEIRASGNQATFTGLEPFTRYAVTIFNDECTEIATTIVSTKAICNIILFYAN